MSDEASGGGFNPCACIWNHEMAMRRLLNAPTKLGANHVCDLHNYAFTLRNSQALCTDTECFEPGSSPPGNAVSTENLHFLTFVIGIALLLFFLRPTQRAVEMLDKPHNNGNNNDAPPAPPIN